jgi:hypothetical protein
MTKSVSQKAQLVMGALMVAAGGAATLRPSGFAPLDDTHGASEQSLYLTRMWALRETALGAILLATHTSAHRRSVLASIAALAAGEIAVSAGTSVFDAKGRTGTIVTAGAFGLISALAAAKG